MLDVFLKNCDWNIFSWLMNSMVAEIDILSGSCHWRCKRIVGKFLVGKVNMVVWIMVVIAGVDGSDITVGY